MTELDLVDVDMRISRSAPMMKASFLSDENEKKPQGARDIQMTLIDER